jgi:hypothetical protein
VGLRTAQAKTHSELLQEDKTTRQSPCSWQKTPQRDPMIVAGDMFALGQPNGQPTGNPNDEYVRVLVGWSNRLLTRLSRSGWRGPPLKVTLVAPRFGGTLRRG